MNYDKGKTQTSKPNKTKADPSTRDGGERLTVSVFQKIFILNYIINW